MRVSLLTRFKMAWDVFNLREFDCKAIGSIHFIGLLNGRGQCDRSFGWRADTCLSNGGPGVSCLSYTRASFKLEEEDHEHVCKECAQLLLSRNREEKDD